MATSIHSRPITADEFFQIRFPSDLRAELVDGQVRMMGGGSMEHARIQKNLMRWFGAKLRGGPCQPWGSDMGVQVNPWSVRYPDLTIDCGKDPGLAESIRTNRLTDPRIIFEVLSPTTRDEDEGAKLTEYRGIASVRMIVLVDPEAQQVRVYERAPLPSGWRDRLLDGATDLDLESAGLYLTLPRAEIFARD
jgi:Uma2 family endonuclease